MSVWVWWVYVHRSTWCELSYCSYHMFEGSRRDRRWRYQISSDWKNDSWWKHRDKVKWLSLELREIKHQTLKALEARARNTHTGMTLNNSELNQICSFIPSLIYIKHNRGHMPKIPRDLCYSLNTGLWILSHILIQIPLWQDNSKRHVLKEVRKCSLIFVNCNIEPCVKLRQIQEQSENIREVDTKFPSGDPKSVLA